MKPLFTSNKSNTRISLPEPVCKDPVNRTLETVPRVWRVRYERYLRRPSIYVLIIPRDLLEEQTHVEMHEKPLLFAVEENTVPVASTPPHTSEASKSVNLYF